MNQRLVILRSANPTIDEGLKFAYYLDEAFEGLFRLMLGRQAADIVAAAYTQPNHDFSYQHAIFAECNKTIVGMATGYTTEQHHGYSDQPLKQAAGEQIFEKMRVTLLCARLRFLGTHTDGDFYLQAIATSKEFRGQGVGSALLDAIEDRARASGSTRLVLDASARNEGARRLYERHGMTVELQQSAFPFLPRFIIQMTKRL
ncbi:MAG: GNAT family N-acetyltransferase [Anaerolineales bacterium]|nr:GNAT family N-acetyltransferase [Anaerolineales bacterium]